MGEATVYDFAGGSRFINEVYFCSKCHIKVYNRSPTEVIEGMVSVPLGWFKKMIWRQVFEILSEE